MALDDLFGLRECTDHGRFAQSASHIVLASKGERVELAREGLGIEGHSSLHAKKVTQAKVMNIEMAKSTAPSSAPTSVATVLAQKLIQIRPAQPPRSESRMRVMRGS
jgi:hypothetical protein